MNVASIRDAQGVHAAPFPVDYPHERVLYQNYILPDKVSLAFDLEIANPVPPLFSQEQETTTNTNVKANLDQTILEDTLKYLSENRHLLNTSRAAEEQFTLKQIKDFAAKLGIKPTGGKKNLVNEIKNRLVEMGY